MNVLGISAFYHDAAAALVRDGLPLAAAQEERFTRRKHDASFPKRAIRFCLQETGLEPRELDWVVFYEKPLRKFERILLTHLRHFPYAARAFSRAMFLWLGDRLWLKNQIASEIGVDPSRVLFTEHHQSHAASAFLVSPFEESAILTVDGVGEWATTTLARGRGNDIEMLAEIHFPDSLGLLYSAITAFLGFEVNEGEQKVMGLAAYGEPRFAKEIGSLIERFDDGSFRLDLDAFRYPFNPDKSFGEAFVRLLGEPRIPGGPILCQNADRRHADIAASVQVVLEEAMLGLARQLHRRAPSRNLCLSGGVALNVLANTRLLKEGPFERLFVQPAAGDSGGALGAALYVIHAIEGAPRRFVQDHSFFGEAPRDERTDSAKELPDDDAVIEEIVERLIAGKTVGLVRGRFEWGPRALGHRSLLADPRRAEMKDHINRSVKHREPFRPFGPSVLAERAQEYFDLPAGADWAARFMLLATPTPLPGREAAPAALHVDGTARVQLVHRDVDPFYHRLIARFGERSGVPILLNTSLNLKGDPMVRGERDGLDLMERSELDVLVVENRLYDRS